MTDHLAGIRVILEQTRVSCARCRRSFDSVLEGLREGQVCSQHVVAPEYQCCPPYYQPAARDRGGYWGTTVLWPSPPCTYGYHWFSEWPPAAGILALPAEVAMLPGALVLAEHEDANRFLVLRGPRDIFETSIPVGALPPLPLPPPRRLRAVDAPDDPLALRGLAAFPMGRLVVDTKPWTPVACVAQTQGWTLEPEE